MSRKARIPIEVVTAIEGFIDECRKPSGSWENHRGSLLHQKTTDYLKANPFDVVAEDQAYEFITRFVAARSLTRHKDQGILFDEYAILSQTPPRSQRKKSEGDAEPIVEQIEMGRARQFHIIRHIGVLTSEMQISVEAYNDKLIYFNERLEYFQDGDTLLDVEKRHFGYIPEDEG